MRHLMRMTILVSVLLLAYDIASSQEWRGIVLLKSTCDDVKRALNVEKCDRTRAVYKLPGETVVISFAQGDPCPKDCPAGMRYWNVPIGTVLEITRTLDDPLPVTTFDVGNDQWHRSSTDFVSEVIYGNSKAGLMLNVVDGKVKIITYYPSANNNASLCPQCAPPKSAAPDAATNRANKPCSGP